MKTKITMTSKTHEDVKLFEFKNHIETKLNSVEDPELFFMDMYLNKLIGQPDSPINKVGILAEYDTLKILLSSMIKNYIRYQVDRFIDTRI